MGGDVEDSQPWTPPISLKYGAIETNSPSHADTCPMQRESSVKTDPPHLHYDVIGVKATPRALHVELHDEKIHSLLLHTHRHLESRGRRCSSVAGNERGTLPCPHSHGATSRLAQDDEAALPIPRDALISCSAFPRTAEPTKIRPARPLRVPNDSR